MMENRNREKISAGKLGGRNACQQRHFTQQEGPFHGPVVQYQSFQLNRTNYGLLPFKKGEPVSNDFSIWNSLQAPWKSV